MLHLRERSALLLTLLILGGAWRLDTASAADAASQTGPASRDAELAMKKFQVAPGLKIELFAAEPLLANPVALCPDEHGRWYVAETFRHTDGVLDIRGRMHWLDEELASKSVEDRVAIMRKHLPAPELKRYSTESEQIRLIEDRDGDGRADFATVFAEGFSRLEDGIGAGLLARKGDVWFTCIPDLWWLKDRDGDGVADMRKSLQHGYGVRVGFLGHDLHGLRFGPDGKLYFTVGDRGFNVTSLGRSVAMPETGAVLRCNPDGSDLEIFAYGLRNPQELAFDEFGNLFTADNNSDGGDQARWVYLVEGGDSGWHIGWQFIERPNLRGPWNSEKMWRPQNNDQPAYIIPPVTNIANGPSGLTHFPGTGWPERLNGHFLLCDFRGGAGSGVHSFAVQPKGAGFELIDHTHFFWEILATDVEFGMDGGVYVADWVAGWNKTGQGRIYRVSDPALTQSPPVLETRKLLAAGFDHRSLDQLARLLTHPDMRVRQEAQFALAAQGAPAIRTLSRVAQKSPHQLARLHAIWGLGQIEASLKVQNLSRGRVDSKLAILETLLPMLSDPDPEVRAQTARVLGEARATEAYDGLVKLLADPEPRPRFFAAIGLGKLGRKEALSPLLEMLRSNKDDDIYLRHAGVMGLSGLNDVSGLQAAAQDKSPAVRLAVLLSMRRLGRPEISLFLRDTESRLIVEAARAVNDTPILEAMPQLASLITQPLSAEALFRRVLNASFRLGTAETANSLAQFAAQSSAPEPARVEALECLGDWARPSGRDRVVGLWRPLPARDPQVAADALRPFAGDILRGAPDSARLAAIKSCDRLSILEAMPVLLELVTNHAVTAAVRVEALRVLGQRNNSRLAEAVQFAQADASEIVRQEATRWQAQARPGNAQEQLRTTLTNGSVPEKQAALAALAALPDADTDTLLLSWLENLIAGKVPAALQLDLIEAAGKRSAPVIKDKLRQFEAARSKTDDLSGHRECLAGGDASEGRKIFYERVEVSCFRCHKINGEGGEIGPDLSGSGAKQSREYILESILFPNKKVAAGFETVIVTLQNGMSYAGLVKSETATELELNSPEDGPVKLKKADIKSRERGLSAMPEEIRSSLTKRDLRNLVEFLGGIHQ